MWETNNFNAISDDLNEDNQLCSVVLLGVIEERLKTANLSQNELNEISLDDLTQKDAEKLLEYLNNNQICKISAGIGYSQTDIIRKIRKEIL